MYTPGRSGWATCDSRGVRFPLEALSAAVLARAEAWAKVGLCRTVLPVTDHHGTSTVRSQFESTTWIVEVMIWDTGEAELSTVRLTDDRVVNKHYDLVDRADLDVMLDELVALLVEDVLPGDAVVVRFPGAPA
jgi:hypothetical protein